MTTWLLSREGAPHGVTVAKMRVTRPIPAELRVHPGRDWFTVLSGTVVLRLGERTILVQVGEAAEFSTMVPHAFGAHDGAAHHYPRGQFEQRRGNRTPRRCFTPDGARC